MSRAIRFNHMMHKEENTGTSFIIESKEPFSFSKYDYIDDEKMIIDNTKVPFTRILTACFAVGFGVLEVTPFFTPVERWTLDIIIAEAFLGIIFIGCVITFINVLLNTDRKFIFNRMEGILTMRSSVLNWIPGTITIPFREARLGYAGPPISKIVNVSLPTSKFRYLSIRPAREITDVHNMISFFVWYMDRNRPLPPAKELDSYREKDFERRKSEGFPSPLYPATVDMTDFDGDRYRYEVKKNIRAV